MFRQSCTIWSNVHEFNIMVGSADLQSTRHTTEVSCSMYKDEHTATFRQESHWCTGQHILSTNSPTDAQVSISCPQTVPLMHRSAYPVHKQFQWCIGQLILSTNSPTDAQISVSCPQTAPLMHRSAYSVHKQSHWWTDQRTLPTNSPTGAQVSISCPQTIPWAAT